MNTNFKNKLKYIFNNNYLLFALIPLVFISNNIGWGGDFSLYINQSIHLIGGNIDELYASQVEILKYQKVGPFLYPMGVSILISPVIYLFGVNFLALKIYNLFFWIGSIYFLKRTLENIFTEKKLIITTVYLVLFSSIFIGNVNNITSDIFFFFFFNLWLYISTSNRRNTFNSLIISGFILFLLLIIRPVSYAVFASYLVYCFYKMILTKKIKYLLPILLPSFLYFVYTNIFNYNFSGNELEYVFKNIKLSTPFNNLIYYFELFFDYLLYPFSLVINKFISINHKYLFTSIIFLISSFFIFKKYFTTKNFKLFLSNDKLLLVFIVSVAILLLNIITPINNGIRYIFPIIPFGIYFTFKFFSKKFVIIFVVFQLLNTIFYYTYNYTNILRINSDVIFSNTNESKKVYDYIKNNLKNDTIIFIKPRVLFLYTNIQSVPETNETIKKFKTALVQNYISEDELYQKINKKVIFETENYKLYKLLNEK